jgi:hypothetical protein
VKEQARNVRDYGMYVALVLIIVVFEIATKGLFLSSRNIANLVVATSYIAVIAVGMTLVIVIRHTDLSVGFLAGTLGAIAGLSLQFWGLPLAVTIPLVLVLGLGAGLVTGALVAQLPIPACVATLAGRLFLPRYSPVAHPEHRLDHHHERYLQRARQRLHLRHPTLSSPCRCSPSHIDPGSAHRCVSVQRTWRSALEQW